MEVSFRNISNPLFTNLTETFDATESELLTASLNKQWAVYKVKETAVPAVGTLSV